MRRLLAAGTLGALAALALAAPASAQVALTRVGDFVQPTYVAAPPGDGRLFVVEQGVGTVPRVQVVRDGVQATFLDMSGKVVSSGERGLLSMAFAPDFATSGRFFVAYTGAPPFVPAVGDVQVDEYRVSAADADRADPATRRPLLTVPHSGCPNHNGGQLQIGPDGMLWFGTGDGGGANDPNSNGQRLAGTDRNAAQCGNNPLLGKLLRLDPATGAAAPNNPFGGEAAAVWALGLRNPWRFSFDRVTQDLVIGDVGQGAIEEVDLARASSGLGRGANYGWSAFEGTTPGPSGGPLNANSPTHSPPVVEHTHGSGWCSITGGYVVRDPGLPALAGQYVYGDFCLGHVFAADLGAGTTRDLGLAVSSMSTFGEDACGRVYVASLDGPVYRLGSSGCAAVAPPRFPVAPGAGPGGPAAAADRRPPVLRLTAARRQRALRKGYVAGRVRCDEPCAVRLSGSLRIGKRRIRLRSANTSLAANRTVALRVKFSRTSRRALRTGVRRGRRVRFVLTAGAFDAARNAVRRTAVIRNRR